MDTDVVVVGAGPTGLMLAAELRLAGAKVIVLERLSKPTGQSRGLGFTARALEVFDQRGLLPAFGELETSPMGHFGGLVFDYSIYPGANFGARNVAQSKTEAVLEEWAGRLGADIRRGWSFEDVTDVETHVEVSVDTGEGSQRLSASYLVGCDGGQGAVRKAAGFVFPGTAATMEMYLGDISGCNLQPRPLGQRVPTGMVMAAPLGDGVDRIIVCEHGAEPKERTEPPSFEEVAGAWERLTGEDLSTGEPLWLSTFSDSARQVDDYRRRRVLLAGDAAHIQLPAGGQGLSTGVQDAVNLGWKLGAEIAGWAPSGLLDTYQQERHPVGRRLLMNTRAQGLLFLSGEEMSPLRELFGELLGIDAVSRHLAGMVSHLDIRYDLGEEADPLVGARLVSRKLLDARGVTTTTTDLLRSGRGVLFDLADGAAARQASDGWDSRVSTATATLDDFGTDDPWSGVSAVLVRPDGHIAWTSRSTAALPSALRRWFGEPAQTWRS